MPKDPLEEALSSLLTELADTLRKQIATGEAPAAVLKEARELLKDNGIEVSSLKRNKALIGLSEVILPDFEDDSEDNVVAL